MATVYISPSGAGTGSGDSEANAVNWNSGAGLGTAETAAGTGGTIIFLDGSYPFGGNEVFDGANNLTYESQNIHGAILGDSGTFRQLQIGSASVDGIAVNKFKFVDVNQFYQYGAGSTNNTMDQCLHTSTVAHNLGSSEWFYGNSGQLDVTNTSFNPNITVSGYRFFSSGNRFTFNNCTFNFTTSSISTGIGFMGTPPTSSFLKNTIMACDDDSAVNSGSAGDFAQFATNCCFFQMGTQNDSGGTNNLYDTDPQFVDASNADLRLRPNSLCIGAGTAS